jgi:hypothetical protein
MPDNLAQGMSDGDLVDLLAYLGTLKQPVSIVGQYRVVGPVAASSLDPSSRVDLDAEVPDGEGRKSTWRRMDANAEGIADLGAVLPAGSTKVAYAAVPIASAAPQKARLVLDTPADVAAWLDGKPASLARSGKDGPYSAEIDIPEGASALLIRMSPAKSGQAAPLVTTIVAPGAVEFGAGASGLSSR